MRHMVVVLLGSLLLAGGGCGSSAPAGPPTLTADEEREILERMNQVQGQEAHVPQPE